MSSPSEDQPSPKEEGEKGVKPATISQTAWIMHRREQGGSQVRDPGIGRKDAKGDEVEEQEHRHTR